MIEYDENEAVRYMRSALDAESARKYTDDDLLNIVDMIWDYYEMNGLLDVDSGIDDEEDMDIVSELIDYAGRMIKKDKGCHVDPAHLEPLIRAELDYEDKLDAMTFDDPD